MIDQTTGWVVVKEQNGEQEIVSPVLDAETEVYNKLGFKADFFKFKQIAEQRAKDLNKHYPEQAFFSVKKAKIELIK